MTKHEAHTILDTAKAGGLVPASLITQALGVTGDLTWASPKALVNLQTAERLAEPQEVA